jgi:hypothetical protein
MSLEEGTIYEYRLKRLYFYMGNFARRGVTVRPLFEPGSIKIADVDVLGLKFSAGFRPHLTIGECKSGENVGTIDRFLWILGLSEYLQADEVFIAKRRFTHKTNELARSWGILALDDERIAELEQVWISHSDLWLGSHDYRYFYERHRQLYDDIIKRDSRLKAAFVFARSEFWYTENTIRLKRTITHIDDLAKSLVGDWAQDDIAYSQRWLILELIILFSISVLCLCYQSYSFSKSDRERLVAELLAAGLLPIEELRKIRQAALRYVHQKVKELTGQGMLFPPEANDVPPPEYTESLIDIVERLLARETHASEIPRLLDLVVFEGVLKSGPVAPEIFSSLFHGDLEFTLKLAKNLLFFLFDHTNLEKEQVADLLAWELSDQLST